ncbi:MAG: hypothetical protein ACTSW1_06880 [Candidatus Hodarchaeales archaeon]
MNNKQKNTAILNPYPDVTLVLPSFISILSNDGFVMEKFILAKDQKDLQCSYSFNPGQQMFFKAYFQDSMENYHLRIIDQQNNIRLNSYGRMSAEGVSLAWKIPSEIRNHHCGIWQIEVNIQEKTYRLFFFVNKAQEV